MKTELDIRREPKRVGKLGWFDVKNKPQHPRHMKVTPKGQGEGYRSATRKTRSVLGAQ